MGGIPSRVRDPERMRRIVGLLLYIVLMLVSGTLLLIMFLLLPLATKDPAAHYEAMAIGAALALPALFVYLWLPWILDRYDPEPLWALTIVLLWGFVGACGFSAVINTMVGGLGEAAGGPELGEFLSACVSAPVVEEAFKGLAVVGMYFFVKREFDGVVDAIIYATFTALGFAACENILYYGRAAMMEAAHPDKAEGVFAMTVFMRGVLSPWIHPLFTSMTGVGVGIARETEKTWLKWLAPMGGYAAAVFLHATWNTAATLSGMLTLVMLPLWILFVLAFLGILISLVVRKGRIIRQHLQDEVLLGNLTQWELGLVSSAWAHWKATFSFGGGLGRQFVAAAARLGLSKWHAGRAARGRSHTVSADFVVPLRQDLHRLRAAISHRLGRPLPQPQPWQPPPAPGYGQPPPYAQWHQGAWRR